MSTGGVADATQIHTHLCHSELGEIGAIDGLDAEVTGPLPNGGARRPRPGRPARSRCRPGASSSPRACRRLSWNRSAAGAEVVEYPVARTVLLQLNQSAPPFADIRVRQAVTAAIDRPVLADQVLAGGSAPASDLFGAAVPWGAATPPPGADVERTKQLLAKAGFGPQNPLTVRLWTFPNRPELPALANAIQAMLGAAGVKVDITVGNYEAQEPKVLAGDYDMFLNSRSYLSDFPDAASTLTSDYTCDGSYAVDQYCSPAYDALVDRLNSTEDPAARQQLFGEAAAMLTRDAVGVMVVHPRNTAVLRGATGFVPDPLQIRPVLPQLSPTTG